MLFTAGSGLSPPDPLTRLPTRREFLDRLAAELGGTGTDRGAVAVLMVDVDGFRRINRELGHAIGDDLLFSAARRIASAVGPSGLLSRASGDEFAVMICDLSSPGEIAEVGARILDAFDDQFELGAHRFAATVSIGAAATRDSSMRPEVLVAEAEAALESSPPAPRRFEVFDASLREQIHLRVAPSRELGRAIEAGALRIAYQPIVDVASGRVVCLEALARWSHPEHGEVSPEHFVALAAEAGMAGNLLTELLDRAGSEFATIAGEDPTGRVSLAVNVSAADLTSESLIDVVAALVERSGVAAQRIVIEISESALSGAAGDYLARVSELRALGVRISLDDFGTASTSISQLRSLPIDQIKLDRSFVEGLGSTSRDAALAAGLLPIARALGIEVVAEGIETDQQLAHLFALGYRLGQGYRFAMLVDAGQASAVVARGPLVGARAAEAASAAPARETFRRALLAGDAKGAEAVVASAMEAGIDPLTIQTEIIGRALHWIDSEWEAGRLNAADEHLAAAICGRELAVVLDSSAGRRRRFDPTEPFAAVEARRQGGLNPAAATLDPTG